MEIKYSMPEFILPRTPINVFNPTTYWN